MKLIRFTGIFAFVLFFIVAAISISFNPWFNFYHHAFSSLGSSNVNLPWIYNVGMMVIGAFIIIYSLTFLYDSNNKIESAGAALILVTGVFLIMIGIFYDGTRPHNFVSAYFFGQAEVALIVSGIGLVMSNILQERRAGWIIVAFSIGALIVALLFDWPSSAAVEEYGIFTIGIRVILLTRVQLKRLISWNLSS